LTDGEKNDTASDFDGRRTRFRQYDSPEVIDAYLQRLEAGWPERKEIAAHITEQIVKQVEKEEQAALTILELCCGPGQLAKTLLQRLPTVQYTGIDLSPSFLTFAEQQLKSNSARVTLVEADLNDAEWPNALVPIPQEHQDNSVNDCITDSGSIYFDAIVSMQSLHDVGDEAVIARIYRQAKEHLLPGGFLLNADLVVPVGEELPKNPGRRSIPRHLELLTEAGYAEPRCTLARGNFGAVLGWNR